MMTGNITMNPLPEYQVRVSQRAKNVSIHISHQGKVEVVVPRGFDQSCIPEIVSKRQEWIARTTQRLEMERQTVPAIATEPLPQQVWLQSIPEKWTVSYRSTAGSRLVANMDGQKLKIQGPTSDIAACQRLLQRWLSHKAQHHLTPWLRQVSREVSLPCGTITIRHQKTLWASCSSKKSISLNAKLLFLPQNLVRYVLIHELCHTVHMDHSPRFWALVGEKEPDYKQLDEELRKAWRFVPTWAE
jgi:predicted metal-dependent hydrolase